MIRGTVNGTTRFGKTVRRCGQASARVVAFLAMVMTLASMSTESQASQLGPQETGTFAPKACTVLNEPRVTIPHAPLNFWGARFCLGAISGDFHHYYLSIESKDHSSALYQLNQVRPVTALERARLSSDTFVCKMQRMNRMTLKVEGPEIDCGGRARGHHVETLSVSLAALNSPKSANKSKSVLHFGPF